MFATCRRALPPAETFNARKGRWPALDLIQRHFVQTLAEGAARAANTPGARVIDVRTPEEYAEGHLPGAENIPLDAIPRAHFEQGGRLFVYCYSGARSGRAVSFLKGKGLDAVNMGGIAGYKGKLEK